MGCLCVVMGCIMGEHQRPWPLTLARWYDLNHRWYCHAAACIKWAQNITDVLTTNVLFHFDTTHTWQPKISRLCQMVSSKKNGCCVTHILDISTNPTNTIVFTSISTIELTRFHLSSTIIGRVRLVDYIIYSLVGTHCWAVCTSLGINNIFKWVDFSNYGAWRLKYCLFDGRNNTMVLIWWRYL